MGVTVGGGCCIRLKSSAQSGALRMAINLIQQARMVCVLACTGAPPSLTTLSFSLSPPLSSLPVSSFLFPSVPPSPLPINRICVCRSRGIGQELLQQTQVSIPKISSPACRMMRSNALDSFGFRQKRKKVDAVSLPGGCLQEARRLEVSDTWR